VGTGANPTSPKSLFQDKLSNCCKFDQIYKHNGSILFAAHGGCRDSFRENIVRIMYSIYYSIYIVGHKGMHVKARDQR